MPSCTQCQHEIRPQACYCDNCGAMQTEPTKGAGLQAPFAASPPLLMPEAASWSADTPAPSRFTVEPAAREGLDDDRRRMLEMARVYDEELCDSAQAEEAYLRILQIDAFDAAALARDRHPGGPV